MVDSLEWILSRRFSPYLIRIHQIYVCMDVIILRILWTLGRDLMIPFDGSPFISFPFFSPLFVCGKL